MTSTALTKTERLTDPYVVAGDRAHLIGRQDGGFPRIGEHIPGEMGGLWAHPHKLLDGFWCAVTDAQGAAAPPETTNPPSEGWLPPAARFDVTPWSAGQWFDLPDLGVRLCRTLFVPDGRSALLIDLDVYDSAGHPHEVELTILVHSNLRPGWLDPRPDGRDRAAVTEDGAAVVATDPTGPWWVAWGSLDHPVDTRIGVMHGPEPLAPGGSTAAQRFRLTVPANGHALLRLGVHGSTDGAADAVASLHDLLSRADELTRAKKERLTTALQVSRLDVPDDRLARAWSWTRCAYDWLVRDVPGVGRGLGAGLPEFPWWFTCDSAYALRGLLPLGDFEPAGETLRLLARVSERHNPGTGRIVHELSCTDHVFNAGNTQETPQFACAVLETYLWSGDRGLIEDLYPLCRQGVLSWTLGACDRDGDLLPEGAGITEVLGLDGELIDSAVWAHEGLRALGRMATLLDDGATAARCAALAPRVRAAIEQRFWLPAEGLYADWVDTPAEAERRLGQMRGYIEEYSSRAGAATLLAHIDALRERAATLPPDVETTWPLGYWVIAAPLEAGLTPRAAAERAFARLESSEFSGPAGFYLSGIERDKAMSICTSALAAAACAYGRVEQALDASRLLAGMVTLRMPGAISEYSPDGGCFVQAWSGYGVVYPLVHGVFGLYPDAAARHLVLCPYLPAGWSYARLHNVRVGDAWLDIELERPNAEQSGEVVCRLHIDTPGWRATVVPFAAHSGGVLPPLTPLSVHASPVGPRWDVMPEVMAAGKTVDLPACIGLPS